MTESTKIALSEIFALALVAVILIAAIIATGSLFFFLARLLNVTF